ncbi:Anaerobic glycerol-3-phosphate dehydrogenase subunit C [Tepidimonas alkaliphilus]|uniref:Glycolate oxidase iron-sulfur subunit n=1 Tax=Tepidimonas alkaliphilus TaxID=2588942 RepID=A0A554W832_9BURK|nr:glycolate oxidase subunit GlcF [Tepidimonas alkaliphilus]TSE19733.1 Anaerobic glycerol-3-phosphate dehydrogenase subunit C [Tepidimonas alkaliphilus]
MQTQLAPEFAGTPEGQEAEAILRRCVHCGFCTATCPTYQLLGDELDGPRGRIYLIKQVLEGAPVTRATQQHLDRCLTCRNCETTCPSGVAYGHLLDIGRKVVEQRVARPPLQRALRALLREGLTSPLFAPAMRLGQAVRRWLPASLRAKVPPRRAPGAWPQTPRARRVLMLAGCVQPAMLPNVNAATARVLDAAGIQTLVAPKAGCCGAIRFHLDDQLGALAEMRANIDAWWPYVEPADGSPGVEAIVINASGCGVTVKDYGHQLRHDPAYAAKAARISALARDLSELLPDLLPAWQARLGGRLPDGVPPRLAYHPPCTLQHGQRLRGGVEAALRALGFEVSLPAESHLCCGSAGTYSVLQPALAGQLRERKLQHLHAAGQPQAIVSANIGCITHLQAGTPLPVRHWVELVDEALTRASPA